MTETRPLMGMPVTVEVVDPWAGADDLGAVFAHFAAIDARWSTYKPYSEISRLNRGELPLEDASDEMRRVLALCDETKRLTDGYFDIVTADGTLDPSGLVKGWAIRDAGRVLEARGFRDYAVEAGGDIQFHGRNAEGKPWRAGIRDPRDATAIVKAVALADDEGIATSGTSMRGQHIYDPRHRGRTLDEVLSITVIGPDVYEADRFATAAFAMGRPGIAFIAGLPGFAGYQIDKDGIATATRGFAQYADAYTEAYG